MNDNRSTDPSPASRLIRWRTVRRCPGQSGASPRPLARAGRFRIVFVAISLGALATETAAGQGTISAVANTPTTGAHAFAPVSDESTRVDRELPSAEASFVARMRERLQMQPLLRRPFTLEQLRADRAFHMKYAEKPAHLARVDSAGWERFALSLADADGAGTLSRLLPAAAVAGRLSDDPAILGFVRDQLAELATWEPLQRAGWSGGSATRGAWLGTGWAVRAIVQACEHLPEDETHAPLRAALRARLVEEIAGIREDWRTERTWFARIGAASSNQWILPLEALALASLFNGLEHHRDDYEFAVAGLLRSLDAQGSRGECVEGMLYGAITYESLLSAALATQAHGDDRLISHPWIRAFPTWYLHHRQPAGHVINAFDSQAADLNWPLVGLMASELRDPGARWVFARRPALPSAPATLDLALLRLARDGGAEAAEPPALFAAYDVAARVNWVESASAFASGPENRVSGFWMRGGSSSDAHDHQDRGHVNFIVAGRPVLIEAGLASYGIPEHPTHYKSVAGHNVLQVGAFAPSELTPAVLAAGAGQILDPAHRSAPITVHRLGARGGEVTVDASGCYATTRRWTRTATWDATTLTVVDQIELAAPDTVLLRWHLGADADALVTHLSNSRATIDGIHLAWDTDDDAPLHASIEAMPDNTLHGGKPGSHTTVVVRTAAPISALALTTRIALSPPVQP